MSAQPASRSSRATQTRRDDRGSAAPWRAASIGYAPSTQTPNPQGMDDLLRLYDEMTQDDEQQ